jgi:hypothetical protein
LQLPLQLTDKKPLAGGSLHIQYRTQEDDGRQLIAESTVKLP